jgi:WD40 repeat protein
LVIPPPTATPPLPEPTIGPDTLAALRPLRAFGLGGARSVAIAPGGKILAVATTAGVALFELPALRHLRFDPIDGGAWQLAWSPDARQLAVAIRTQATQNSIAIYHVADGAVLATLPGDEPVWSHDGQTLAATVCQQACRTTLTRTDGTPAVTLDGGAPIFSPDSRTIITSAHPLGGDDNQAHYTTMLWSAEGRRLADLSGIYTQDFSPDSKIVAIASFGTDAQAATMIRRSADGGVIRTLAGGLPVFSHAGTLLAVTDGITVSIWKRQDLEAQGGQPLHTFTAPITEAGKYGNALSFSPDDQVLHAVLGHSLYSWRVVDGTPLGTVANAAAEGVAFEANGAILSLLAAGGDSPPTTSLIDTANGAAFYQGLGENISFGDDNTTIAVLPFDGPVRVLSRENPNGAEVDLPAYTGVAFSPDAQTIALSTHNTLSLWNVVDSTRKQELHTDMGSPVDELSGIGLRYSADGRLLMYESERNNIYEGISASAITWDVASGQQTHIAHSGFVQRSTQMQNTFFWAFSVESAAAFSYSAGNVEIQASTGLSLTVTTPVTATALAFSPGGALLAIGDAGGAVRLVNTADGSNAHMLRAGAAVRSLVFSPDGTLLAAPRADGAVPVWRMGDIEPMITLAGSPGDGKLIFTADNQLALVAGTRGIAFYHLPDGALLSTLPVEAGDIAIGPRRRLLAVLHNGRVMLWGIY